MNVISNGYFWVKVSVEKKYTHPIDMVECSYFVVKKSIKFE